LRHSYASHLLHEGVNVTDVAAVLGRASPTTTMQSYPRPNEDRGYIADKLTADRARRRVLLTTALGFVPLGTRGKYSAASCSQVGRGPYSARLIHRAGGTP
jgi:hypothetical protein